MSENELNIYRFNPEKEPTVEMLEQIMKEVAEEANRTNQKASEEYWMRMQQDIVAKQERWKDKISALVDDRE